MDSELTGSQNKIYNYLKKQVKPELLKMNWHKEGQRILMNKDTIYLTENEKIILKFLIVMGTPDIYRIKLWLIASGAKRDIILNPYYYQNLLKLSQKCPSLYKNQIEKDIKRTKSSSLKKHPEYVDSLRNVLICFSIRNSSVGYCQGFNFIAMRLIEVLHNEVNKHRSKIT